MFATRAVAESENSAASKPADPKYERKKLREAERQRQIATRGREIGELPPVADPARKAMCERNLRLYCQTYFPDICYYEWSRDQLEVIKSIQTTVLEGGMFAVAMPRGTGKTTLCEIACSWAASYGHHLFILLIAADATAASENLDSVRSIFEENELLAADFPEICYPIQKLEGIQQRRLLYKGKLIRLKITKNTILLPTIPGSKAAGVVFKVAGITGRIRGMKHPRQDGTFVRPSLCLLDDPQTDESAHSDIMCKTRERIVSKAVRGLAGPGKKIAAIMPCTVIRRGDMADRMLNRDLHPAWHGKRFKMIYEWPERMDLWEKYVVLRMDALRKDEPTTAATKFYRENRAEMDKGARVAWSSRYNHDEISAVQNVMNLRYENKEGAEEAFACEFQNEPPDLEEVSEKLPAVEVLQKRQHILPRRKIPIEATNLVAGIDVQGDLLYWKVMALAPDFTSLVPDYDAFPRQPTARFTLKAAQETLSKKYPSAHADGRIFSGLTDLVEELLAQEWKSPTGTALKIEKIGIDASYKPSLIHRFCRESKYASLLWPTHGKGIGVKATPMRNYRVAPGERLGDFWFQARSNAKARTTRHLIIDTNAAKTFMFERLATTIGDPGSLQFYSGHPTNHELLCEHLTAEYRKRVKHDGREVEEWTIKPGKPDNHWLDTTVICLALASHGGCKLQLPGAVFHKPKRRQTREAEYL